MGYRGGHDHCDSTEIVIVDLTFSAGSTEASNRGHGPLGIMNACLDVNRAHPFIPPPNEPEPVREHTPIIQGVDVGNPVRTEPRHPP